jgi:hypothetical protein
MTLAVRWFSFYHVVLANNMAHSLIDAFLRFNDLFDRQNSVPIYFLHKRQTDQYDSSSSTIETNDSTGCRLRCLSLSLSLVRAQSQFSSFDAQVTSIE